MAAETLVQCGPGLGGRQVPIAWGYTKSLIRETCFHYIIGFSHGQHIYFFIFLIYQAKKFKPQISILTEIIQSFLTCLSINSPTTFHQKSENNKYDQDGQDIHYIKDDKNHPDAQDYKNYQQDDHLFFFLQYHSKIVFFYWKLPQLMVLGIFFIRLFSIFCKLNKFVTILFKINTAACIFK